jgi:hypothetical protein
MRGHSQHVLLSVLLRQKAVLFSRPPQLLAHVASTAHCTVLGLRASHVPAGVHLVNSLGTTPGHWHTKGPALEPRMVQKKRGNRGPGCVPLLQPSLGALAWELGQETDHGGRGKAKCTPPTTQRTCVCCVRSAPLAVRHEGGDTMM